MSRKLREDNWLLVPLPEALVSSIDRARGSLSREEYLQLVFETADQASLIETHEGSKDSIAPSRRSLPKSGQLDYGHSLIPLPQPMVKEIDRARDSLSRAEYLRLVIASADDVGNRSFTRASSQSPPAEPTEMQQETESRSASKNVNKPATTTQPAADPSKATAASAESLSGNGVPDNHDQVTAGNTTESEDTTEESNLRSENGSSEGVQQKKPTQDSGLTVGMFATSWAVAFGTYGAGDVTSTLFSLSTGSAETNPIMQAALQVHPAAMVLAKVGILGTLFYITRHRLLDNGYGPREGMMLLAVPAILSLVGSYATVSNIMLLPDNLKLYAAVSSLLGGIAAGALVMLYEDFLSSDETKRWNDQIEP
jgi:hypothetical protein